MSEAESNRVPASLADVCSACGTERKGPYCSGCGHCHRLPARPLGAFAKDALRDLHVLGDRLVRSLGVLAARPGQLSVDYLRGHHSRFTDPIRLFRDVGVGAFLLTRLLPSEATLFGLGPILFGEHPTVTEWLEALYFLVAAALAHWLVLRQRRPLFIESAVFVLHVAAFSFLLAPVAGLLSVALGIATPDLQLLASLVPPLALAIYWILALRRFNDSDREQNAKDLLLIYGAFLLLVTPLSLLSLL